MSGGPSAAGQFFDAYGSKEWDRLEGTVEGRVKYAIHARFINDYIHAGARVADIGCGPGRFAIDVLRRGALVTLVDVSSGQLAEAESRIQTSGLGAGLEAAICADACQLPMLASASFDAVICYGGVLSYAWDRHEEMLDEVVRLCRPGGTLLLSVMSLAGAMMLAGTLDAEHFLTTMPDHVAWPPAAAPEVVLTVPASDEFHLPMTLFSAAGLRRLLEVRGCRIERLAAANPISRLGLPLARVQENPDAERQLTQLELEICEMPGVVEAGAHLVVIATRD